MDIQEKFYSIYGSPPAYLARAPGRVNLLGEHVDYNDGPVLPAAINRQVRLAASPAPGGVVHLSALDLGRQVAFSVKQLPEKIDLEGSPLPNWAKYPAGVAWALQQAGLKPQGMQVVYSSNVPIGAGLSSSAAVEIGYAVLWQALGGWDADRLTLARLCQKAENTYIGVASGLMDQFASACGVAGHVLYFDTRSFVWDPLPLLPQTAIVIADSGVRRSLASSAYNQRREACEQAVAQLQQYKPELHSLRDISPPEFSAYRELLGPEVRQRAEHVVKEIARVESAVTALKRGDAQVFGALMYASHASLRDLYEVSTPELDTLVEIARDLPGCVGARLTGAGFGGCTVNLVETAHTAEFTAGLQIAYSQKTGREAKVYLCRASQGATVARL